MRVKETKSSRISKIKLQKNHRIDKKTYWFIRAQIVKWGRFRNNQSQQKVSGLSSSFDRNLKNIMKLASDSNSYEL